jgi:TolB-like protein
MERPFPAYKGDEPYIFVSYSHHDVEVVYPAMAQLANAGFNIWYDEGINPGSTWRDEVALALTQCKVFLYFITPQSVASSNCLKEVNFSLSRERKILSVHLEPTELPVGLELSLSDMQAILKSELSEEAFQAKMADALQALLPRPTLALIEPPTNDQPITAATADRTSIAVLPLVNRNLDAADDYLCDGIAEELINGLAKIEGLRVASQMASFRFRDQALDPKTIGDQLGVGSILSGSLQRSGNRIRINVRLDDVADGAMLWSNRFDGEMDDLFDLQDDVARQVVEALRVELGVEAPEKLLDIGTGSVEAYNAYLLGRHLRLQLTRRSHLQAKEQFEIALRLDPNFEQANLEAALNLMFARQYEPDFAEQAAERFERASKAGLLGRPVDSLVREMFPERSPPPLGLAQEAIDRLADGDPEWQRYAYSQIADALTATGALRGGLAFFQRYKEFDGGYQLGENPRLDSWEVFIYAALGEFDRAIERYTQMIELEPDAPLLVGERLLLYSRTGQYEKADTELEKVNKVWPRNFPQFYQLYWRREIDAAKAYFTWLGKRASLGPIFKFWGFALVGDIEQSLDHLEIMSEVGSMHLLMHVNMRRVLPTSVVVDIERHPRYKALLTRLSIGDDARQQVIDLVNTATELTGIKVWLDEAY